jgi:hypothetical protein
MDNILRKAGRCLADFKDMPQYHTNWDNILGNRLIREQLDYSIEIETQKAENNIFTFNPEQKIAHDRILDAVVRQQESKLFFLNGLGGTGESYVWNTLAHSCHARGLIVLCVASSGIAALILNGGHTSHSTFSITITITEMSMCTIKKQSM